MSNKDADAIYRLPRVIAIKIFSYLNIEEISICRAVSREWNIITQGRVEKMSVKNMNLWGGGVKFLGKGGVLRGGNSGI